MSTAYLPSKIRTAALAFSGLTALLGAGAAFRWYDTRLQQGTAFPAVVVMVVSNPSDYALTYRMNTSFARVQFEVWGTDPVENDAVVEQISAFLDTFRAYGTTPAVNQAGNYIVNDRQAMFANTQPSQYQRILDVKIFDNSTVTV